MNAIARTTNAEHAGRWLGRAWRRGIVRRETRAIQWLVAGKGVPVGAARLLLWIAKIDMGGLDEP